MKRVLILAALAMSMIISPARAETVQWAAHADASTSYGASVAPQSTALGLAFYALGSVDGALNVVGPALEPTVGVALCTVFSGSPCVPGDPEAFVQDTADGAAEIPDRAPGFLTGLPDDLTDAADGLPGAIDRASKGAAWSSAQATGAPDTYPRCGDIRSAWAPRSNGPSPEFIRLSYAPPVVNAKRIDIYETNIGGFVTSVDIALADGSTRRVFSGTDTTPCAGILSINLSGDPTITAVTIITQAPGWEEIDAVGIAS